MASNTFLHSSAVTKADKSRYTKFSNSKSSDDQNISTMSQFIRKNVTIIPISKTPNSSSTTTTGQHKKMKSSLCQSEQSLSSSNLKISKEITITPYKNNENNLISMLKRLPNITFSCINPQPIFKVPVTPIVNKKIPPKSITSKSKVFFEKNIMPNAKIKCNSEKNMTKIKTKVISEKKVSPEIRKFNNIVNTNPAVLTDNTNNFRKINSNSKKTPIKKLKKIHSNIPLMKNNFKKTITNHSEIPQNYQEKENNIQRTSSPNEIFKKSPNASKTVSKTVKPTKEISNYSTISHEMKTIPDKDSIINNIKVKTNKSINGDYMLMDISTEGQINIIPAYCPLDSTNFCVPEYDTFMMGISKSSDHSIMHSETYHNDVENELLNGHMLSELADSTTQTSTELLHFAKIQNNVIKPLNTNKIGSIHTDLDSGLYSVKESITFDSIKNEHIDVNRKFISSEDQINNKFEIEQISNPYFCNDFSKQPSLQNNETTTPIVLNDNQLLQTMESYLYDNLEDKTSKN